MSEPYLILHKVRGEPAFDIAEPLIIGDEEGWIIPTSGHRAYPITWWNMNEIGIRKFGEDMCHVLHNDYPDWLHLPDHYQASEARSRLATAASDILSLMGIGKPKPQAPVKRRVIP
jgi:hypothetical protein